MGGTFSRSNDYTIAFILNETLLRDYAHTIAENVKIDPTWADRQATAEPLTFDVDLVGGGNYTTTSIDDVLLLSNGGNKKIDGLVIRSHGVYKPQVSLRFRNRPFGNVSYSVGEGDDKVVFYMSSQLEDMIERSRAWYSRWAQADVKLALFGVVAGLGLVVTLGAGTLVLLHRSHAHATTASDTAIANLVLAGLLIAVTAVGSLAAKLRSWLFPIAIFAFGDQMGAEERYKSRRNIVGSGILLALVVNVVAGLMLR